MTCTYPVTIDGKEVPCRTCQPCLDEMQIENRTETHGQRLATPSPVRTMPSLPLKPSRCLGSEDLAGIPKSHHRAVLDIDLLRHRAGGFGHRGATRIKNQVLARASAARITAGEQTTDPLFWCLRAWGNLRSTTLASDNLEPHFQRQRINTLPAQLAPSPLQYRAMAAWACRHSAPEHELRQICQQICDKVRSRDGGRTYRFPCNTTRAWVHWAGTAFDFNCPLPSEALGTTALHRDRWQAMGFGPNNAEILLWLLSSSGPQNDN